LRFFHFFETILKAKKNKFICFFDFKARLFIACYNSTKNKIKRREVAKKQKRERFL